MLKHILAGSLFGCLFPISAYIFELVMGKLSFSLKNLAYIHMQSPLLFMIDTAPLFLGLFASLAGVKQVKSYEANITLNELAIRDDLTGLFNRRGGKEALRKLVDECGATGEFIMFFIDLNNFKLINDTLGHSTGDIILQKVAKKLMEFSSQYGFAIRMGGDEFVVVIKETMVHQDILNMVKLLDRHIMTPLIINNHFITLKGSIGIAQYPHHSTDLDDLLFCADAAMFEAKQSQENYAFYNEQSRIDYKRKLLIKTNLNDAVNENQFHMVYQPIIDSKTLKISGVEALIRWKHPEHGYFSPAEFIPIAENDDLIIKIGYWVIEAVLKDMCEWQQRGVDDIFVTLNISPKQLEEKDFVEKVQTLFIKYSIDTPRIKFEITESTTITNFMDANEMMQAFKDLDIEWFIDDFGSGYTSLSMIRDLSIDCMKIDKSYIDEVNISNSSRQIISALHSLSNGMGMRVLSEGVENADQLKVLSKIGSDYYQGFFISKPLKSETLINNILEGNFSPFILDDE